MKKTFLLSLLAIVSLSLPGKVSAFYDVNFDSPKKTDKWTALNSATANAQQPGGSWGAFGNPNGWTTPYKSNGGAGSVEIYLAAPANAITGPFLATSSIYFGGMASGMNLDGGTVGVRELNPLADVKTITLQVDFGEATGYDFFNRVGPSLYLNNDFGTAIGAGIGVVLNRTNAGTFQTPEGDEDLFRNEYYFQWNISDFGSPVTSFDIRFNGVVHSSVYGLQLDQTSLSYNQVMIPEPSSVALMIGCGIGGLVMMRRRRRMS